jgi:hypothetical protein
MSSWNPGKDPAVRYGVALLGLALAVAGCTIQDPTENTGGVKFINDTTAAASLNYCSNPACTQSSWHDSVPPGKTTQDSVTAGRGNLAVIVIRQGIRVKCLRLTRWAYVLKLSDATRSACHPPFA